MHQRITSFIMTMNMLYSYGVQSTGKVTEVALYYGVLRVQTHAHSAAAFLVLKRVPAW